VVSHQPPKRISRLCELALLNHGFLREQLVEPTRRSLEERIYRRTVGEDTHVIWGARQYSAPVCVAFFPVTATEANLRRKSCRND
jgi:hypothetical protein